MNIGIGIDVTCCISVLYPRYSSAVGFLNNRGNGMVTCSNSDGCIICNSQRQGIIF